MSSGRRRKDFCALSERQKRRRVHEEIEALTGSNVRLETPSLGGAESGDTQCIEIEATWSTSHFEQTGGAASPGSDYQVTRGTNVWDATTAIDASIPSEETQRTESDESCSDCSGIEFPTWLASWVTRHNVPLTAVSELLRKLNGVCNLELPLDARTLLNTPRTTPTRPVPPGVYAHFSLKRTLEELIDECDNLNADTKLELLFYADGMRLGNSTTDDFWPLFVRCDQLKPRSLSLVGCYEGKGKPCSVVTFLSELVQELIALIHTGITSRGRNFDVQVKGFICDAPARAFLVNIKYHSGFYGCGKCKQKGKSDMGKVVFPETNAPLRTDADFAAKACPEHHAGDTPLSTVPLGLVTGFPYEYMHLVCLGVQKKLIQLWKGDKRCRLFKMRADEISSLSAKLVSLSDFVCKEFARKPQSVDNLAAWKATEYRQFLLYTGPVVLQEHLDKQRYQNFLVLHVAITILATPQSCSELNDYAHRLLVSFVETFSKLYGSEHVTYNVHGLVHLAQDVRQFGPLDDFSAFPAENLMGQIKRLVRPGRQQLQQLHRRVQERNVARRALPSAAPDVNELFITEHEGVTLPPGCVGIQYAKANLECSVLKADKANSCCQLMDGTVVVAESFAFASDNRTPMIIGREYKTKRPLYDFPTSSAFFDIWKVSCLSSSLGAWKVQDIKTKCFRFPAGQPGEFAAFPLVHTTVM